MYLKKKLDNRLKKYFNYFSEKKIDKLESLFSNDIQIIDWTANIKKKSKVLDFNKKLFKKFKSINVKLDEKFYNQRNKSFACKLTIKLDNKSINVVDLIYFDSKLQIKKIIAYLR
tara:strand:+ start:89 stop:433 length:345 start_codon:yes stop_codon:yes gene_type:complete